MSGRGAYYKAKYGGGRGGRDRPRDDYNGGAGGGGRGHHGSFAMNMNQGELHKRGRDQDDLGDSSGPTNGGVPGTVNSQHYIANNARSSDELLQTLRRIDGAPYGAYKQIERITYQFLVDPGFAFTLQVVHAQSDAYAAPSKVRIMVPLSSAQVPPEYISNKIRRTALADFMVRQFWSTCRALGADVKEGGQGWAGAKGGDLNIDRPSQHVLERTSVQIICNNNNSNSSNSSNQRSSVDGFIEARFTVGLPARGRSIEGQWAASILTKTVPKLAHASLLWSSLDTQAAIEHILSVEDQYTLRGLLSTAGLVAFVADGSVLPRESGSSDKPLAASSARRFTSPPSLHYSFDLPNRGKTTGMGIRKGITLIVGGGFHGKSTLLRALEVGIYDHIPGDGREFVVTDPSAFKIRAEDGRAVTHLDISAFINNLPFARPTDNFSTTNASGSTSQAANIIEALHLGASLLLLDEDTCATNFMSRDHLMAQLVSADKEPITTFLERVQEIFHVEGVSSIAVVGGCGEYFRVADTVIMMDNYEAKDVTETAQALYKNKSNIGVPYSNNGSAMAVEGMESSVRHFAAALNALRVIEVNSIRPRGGGKIRVNSIEKIEYGDRERDSADTECVIDLSAVEQIVEVGQTRAIAEAMSFLGYCTNNITKNDTARGNNNAPSSSASNMSADNRLRVLLEGFLGRIDAMGLDGLTPAAAGGPGHDYQGNLSRPRLLDIAAAINRWRRLVVLG